MTVLSGISLHSFLLIALTSAAEPPARTALDSYERGMRVLETAFEAHGGEATLARAQRLILEMEGTLDRGARHQGPLPQSNRPTTYREWLV
ncbi:MAG TPA: hypothetical protein VFT12_06130, partial [Thermoanaerobaculia bacterium]|nr:hypothetical protein [Thermoanaerobaculia bacterium]